MITAWMIYAVLTYTVIVVAALALERLCRTRKWPTRWAWVAAMLAPMFLPLIASDSVVQRPGMLQVATGAAEYAPMQTPVTVASVRRSAPADLDAAAGAAKLEAVLLVAWMTLTVAIALVVAAGWSRLRHQSQRWVRSEMAGLEIFVADNLGPAVFGVLRPRIVVPRWLLDADRGTQHAVLGHEREHLVSHDSRLSVAALLLVVLMPWNLPLWFMWLRLRAAIEVDCDARVLRAGQIVEQYAAALLNVAERRGGALLLAAAMHDSACGLEQRIQLMFARRADVFGLTSAALLLLAGGLVATAAQVEAPQRNARIPLGTASAPEVAMNPDPTRRALGGELVEISEEGDVAAATRLIRAGVDVNHVVLGDGTALIVAARHGHLALVRLLLDNGAAPNLAVPGDGNALITAAAYGHRDIVTTLLARGAEVNAVVLGDETPLINAARSGHLPIVRELVEHGADVALAVPADDSPLAEIRSPLSEATKHGQRAVIEYLRAKGAA